jgi:hypothetical protein
MMQIDVTPEQHKQLINAAAVGIQRTGYVSGQIHAYSISNRQHSTCFWGAIAMELENKETEQKLPFPRQLAYDTLKKYFGISPMLVNVRLDSAEADIWAFFAEISDRPDLFARSESEKRLEGRILALKYLKEMQPVGG